jgi:hypothetical protein
MLSWDLLQLLTYEYLDIYQISYFRECSVVFKEYVDNSLILNLLSQRYKVRININSFNDLLFRCHAKEYPYKSNLQIEDIIKIAIEDDDVKTLQRILCPIKMPEIIYALFNNEYYESFVLHCKSYNVHAYLVNLPKHVVMLPKCVKMNPKPWNPSEIELPNQDINYNILYRDNSTEYSILKYLVFQGRLNTDELTNDILKGKVALYELEKSLLNNEDISIVLPKFHIALKYDRKSVSYLVGRYDRVDLLNDKILNRFDVLHFNSVKCIELLIRNSIANETNIGDILLRRIAERLSITISRDCKKYNKHTINYVTREILDSSRQVIFKTGLSLKKLDLNHLVNIYSKLEDARMLDYLLSLEQPKDKIEFIYIPRSKAAKKILLKYGYEIII